MVAPPLVLLLSGLGLVACGDKSSSGDSANHAPIADAGADASGSGIARVEIDGTGSYDPDGDPITYHWSFDRVPSASHLIDSVGAFLNNDTAGASGSSFQPDAAGVYVVKLVVQDDSGLSSTADYVIVTVDGGAAPVANAGRDVTTDVGATATLDGSASYDATGMALSYHWTLASHPATSTLTELTSADTAHPTLVPDVSGVYVAALTVNNGFVDSPPDSTTIYVGSVDPASPVAMAGDDLTGAQDCSLLTLDGTASYDPNGDAISYMWTLQSKPDGSHTDNHTFADRTQAITTFYPDISGTYVFSLSVNDGSTWSSPDEVTAVVAERFANTPPVVDAGGSMRVNGGTALCSEGAYGTWECGSCSPVTVNIGSTVTITDYESDALTYAWTEVSGNIEFTGATDQVSSQVYLTGATPEQPGACAENEFKVQIAATDCPLETGSDVLTVIVMCCGELYSDTGR